MTTLHLVPLSPPFFQQYLSWQADRGRPYTWANPPSLGLWVTWGDSIDTAVPVAGISLFVADMGFMLAEHFATNPQAPLRVRHQAATLIASTIPVLAAAMGRVVQVFPYRKVPSLQKLLARAGFQVSDAVPMYCYPFRTVTTKKRPRERVLPGPSTITHSGPDQRDMTMTAPKGSRKRRKK